MNLFASVPRARPLSPPAEAEEAARCTRELDHARETFVPVVDERMLEVYNHARDPNDPLELRDLWLGRVECELGRHAHRASLAKRWHETSKLRQMSPAEVLSSRATVRFVKELFNFFFRDDLYGDLRANDHLILSSGSVDEVAWGLPETLKECIRYALERDWYGYSDSRGRSAVREAIAQYESARIRGVTYTLDNVAVTMGGTFGISSLVDFILLDGPRKDPVLCGIPNYPPLVESVARRTNIQLVPLPSTHGQTSLAPLIEALTPQTPMVLIQTAANPTGAAVSDAELELLIKAASPSTIILLDECHEWLGPAVLCSSVRAASNVVRVSSLSKVWSAPGLKIGWILADSKFIDEYYEYASTSFGGPPSFFYTMIEVLARMERWIVSNVEPGVAEVNEFESAYNLDLARVQAAYESYRLERIAREKALKTLRDACLINLTQASGKVVRAPYSINMAVEFPGWNDSYKCFRDLLRETSVAVFPGILTFCFSGGIVRITTARAWDDLSTAMSRLRSFNQLKIAAGD